MTTYMVCCFRRRFRPASNEPSEAIGDVFQAYAGGDGALGEEALRRFLREVQGETSDGDLDEAAREIMAFAAEQKLLKKGGGGLTMEGFHRWLCSDANAALHPRRGAYWRKGSSIATSDIYVVVLYKPPIFGTKKRKTPWDAIDESVQPLTMEAVH